MSGVAGQRSMKGSSIHGSVYAAVSAMSYHPVRNEIARLLLHSSYAVKVFFYGVANIIAGRIWT